MNVFHLSEFRNIPVVMGHYKKLHNHEQKLCGIVLNAIAERGIYLKNELINKI